MENLFWIGFVGAAIALLFAWLQRSQRDVLLGGEREDAEDRRLHP